MPNTVDEIMLRELRFALGTAHALALQAAGGELDADARAMLLDAVGHGVACLGPLRGRCREIAERLLETGREPESSIGWAERIAGLLEDGLRAASGDRPLRRRQDGFPRVRVSVFEHGTLLLRDRVVGTKRSGGRPVGVKPPTDTSRLVLESLCRGGGRSDLTDTGRDPGRFPSMVSATRRYLRSVFHVTDEPVDADPIPYVSDGVYRCRVQLRDPDAMPRALTCACHDQFEPWYCTQCGRLIDDRCGECHVELAHGDLTLP